MRDISSRSLVAIGSSHAKAHEILVTEPGGSTPTSLDIDDGSFNVNPSGARYTASLTLTPKLGADLYGLVATPGARFTIRSGIDFGGTDIDWVECGCYEATSGNTQLTVGEIPLGLTDLRTRLARCRFTAPWVVAAGGSRADAIAAMVTDAIPGVTILIEDDGGDQPLAVFPRDRVGAIDQIAADGSLDAAFTAAITPTFRIRKQPLITPTAPDWTAKTGRIGNILTGSREQPFDRPYNTVVVEPIDESQTWSVITISVEDPAHPRHPSKIGVVPFFYRSPMITNAAQASAAGGTVLQQLLGNTDHVQLTVLGNPALEYGDTLSVAHAKTETDPGVAASLFVESAAFDLVTGNQSITARSTSLAELEES